MEGHTDSMDRASSLWIAAAHATTMHVCMDGHKTWDWVLEISEQALTKSHSAADASLYNDG